jgi:ferredoxin
VNVASPAVRTTSCVRFRYRYSACDRCAEVCPHQAIELSDDGVRIAPEKCTNCGLCTTACRAGALTARNMPRIEWLKQAIRANAYSFACAPSGERAEAIVPCLGAIDAAMLAYLAKRRIDVELRGSNHCERCSHGATGASQLKLNLDGAACLSAVVPEEQWAMPTLPEAHGGAQERADTSFAAGRRQLFRRIVGRGVDEVMQSANAMPAPPVPERALRAGAPALNDMRELMQIVCKPRKGGAFRVREHASLPMAELTMSPGCSACEACSRTCPTGALSVNESDETWTLAFNADRCVACGVCVEVCQPKALKARSEFDASPGRGPATLYSLAKQRCRRCDRFFVSARPQENCVVCSDDEEAFDAIFG